MPQQAVGQGLYLAEMIRNYHQFRAAYMTWSASTQPNEQEAILNYQRAILAWYEARIRREYPYTGDVYHFIQVAATHYSGQEVKLEGDWQPNTLTGVAQDPLLYLPHPIQLNETQRLMTQQLKDMSSSCRELLLLAYYHRLSDNRLGEILELGGGGAEAAKNRRKCLLMVRERWQQTGLLDQLIVASPDQQQLIDQYYRHELDVTTRWEVEALRSSDAAFRDAMGMREDWEDCLQIAGRQDTLATLQREEKDYRPKPVTKPKLQLNRPKVSKDWQAYVAIVLFAVLGWLLYTTFGEGREEQLFRTYFKPFPAEVKTTAGRSAIDPELRDMLRYYKNGDYLTAYDDMLPAANAYPAAPLYLGVSALALEQPQRALDWFDQYLPGDYFKPYADWYAALSYLAMGRRPAALSLLIEIAGQENHPYERPATELIEALE